MSFVIGYLLVALLVGVYHIINDKESSPTSFARHVILWPVDVVINVVMLVLLAAAFVVVMTFLVLATIYLAIKQWCMSIVRGTLRLFRFAIK